MQLYPYFNNSVITHIPPLWKTSLDFFIPFWQIRLSFRTYSFRPLITSQEALTNVGLGRMTCFGTEHGEVRVYQFQASPFKAAPVPLLGNA